MAKHRETRTDPNKHHHKIYSKMNELGVENVYIKLIEEYPCENNDQLRAREGHFIRKMATLNGRIEGRDRKQHYQDNKEYIKAKSNKKNYDNFTIQKIMGRKKQGHKESLLRHKQRTNQQEAKRTTTTSKGTTNSTNHYSSN